MRRSAAQLNPYYLVLHAINFNKKLNKRDEARLASYPVACLLYARTILKGRLPDYLHNKMVLEVWEDETDKLAQQEYLKTFSGKSASVA